MDGSPLVLRGFKRSWCFHHIPTDGGNVLSRQSREIGTSEMFAHGELYIVSMPQRRLTYLILSSSWAIKKKQNIRVLMCLNYQFSIFLIY